RDRPVEPRPVGADDGDGIAALEPEAGEPERQGARLFQHLLPGPDLPDAQILVPIGRAIRVKPGIADQELGKGIGARSVSRHGNPPSSPQSKSPRSTSPRSPPRTIRPLAAVSRQAVVGP